MRVLLDTNIVIHRETPRVANENIGILFRWLDQLGHSKCLHPITINEIRGHHNQEVVNSFNVKMQSYAIARTTAEDHELIAGIRNEDVDQNSQNDTSLLNELCQGRFDCFITEDRGIHRKARAIGLHQLVFTIDGFLEKVTAENPELVDYPILSVKKEYFGNLDIGSSFFDSFKADYPGFEAWFNRKADEPAYCCFNDNNELLAFLYVKQEIAQEDYSDIEPAFSRERRLKIGTFKVVSNGYKLGERFIKIVFDNALRLGVESIYVTVFENDENKLRLIKLLQDWGFTKHGVKNGAVAQEAVFVRPCNPVQASVEHNPRKVYPYIKAAPKWIVPIRPEYHTELFPDSVLQSENPIDFIENKPNRNAVAKVYISRSINRNLSRGDTIVFYRTSDGEGPAHHRSVVTTIGVVERVTHGIRTLEDFISACRKRSVFTDDELRTHWDFNPRSRPFVVEFLYVYSFPQRMNLKALREARILTEAPRGFEPLDDEKFQLLLGGSGVDRDLVIN